MEWKECIFTGRKSWINEYNDIISEIPLFTGGMTEQESNLLYRRNTRYIAYPNLELNPNGCSYIVNSFEEAEYKIQTVHHLVTKPKEFNRICCFCRKLITDPKDDNYAEDYGLHTENGSCCSRCAKLVVNPNRMLALYLRKGKKKYLDEAIAYIEDFKRALEEDKG